MMTIEISGDPFTDCTVDVRNGAQHDQVLITVEGDADVIVAYAPATIDPSVLAAAVSAWQREVIPHE
jgi:hypothetical protein